MKKLINTLHLWLGLSVGSIVILLSVTGCILAFQVEIENLTQSYRFVKTEQKEMLPPSVLAPLAEKTLPGKKAHSILYGLPGRSAMAIFFHNDPAYYYQVFLNPYTGEVLKVKNMDQDFFRIVLAGHWSIWLPDEVGQPIVATATLIFIAMLVTGIILWWPKNKAAAKQRFSIKWSARWRRKNYDLHNVLGFYACWVAIFLAITGLVWGFEWFSESLYWATSGGKTIIPYEEAFSDTTQKPSVFDKPVVDLIWEKVKAEAPEAEIFEVHLPEDHRSAIAGSSNPDALTLWKTDNRYYDQYTMKEIPARHIYGRFKSLSVADKIRRMNYDIHVGAVLGLPGKFLAFFASLICASLPVTGFIIWWGRKNKNKGNAQKEILNSKF